MIQTLIFYYYFLCCFYIFIVWALHHTRKLYFSFLHVSILTSQKHNVVNNDMRSSDGYGTAKQLFRNNRAIIQKKIVTIWSRQWLIERLIGLNWRFLQRCFGSWTLIFYYYFLSCFFHIYSMSHSSHTKTVFLILTRLLLNKSETQFSHYLISYFQLASWCIIGKYSAKNLKFILIIIFTSSFLTFFPIFH